MSPVKHFQSFSGKTDYFLLCTSSAPHKMPIIRLYFHLFPFSNLGSPRKKVLLFPQAPSIGPGTWQELAQQIYWIELNPSLQLIFLFNESTEKYCCAILRKKQQQQQANQMAFNTCKLTGSFWMEAWDVGSKMKRHSHNPSTIFKAVFFKLQVSTH